MDEQHVKLFSSLKDLRRESDDIPMMVSFTAVEEKSHILNNIMANITNKPDNEIISFIQRYHTSFLNYLRFTESDESRSTMQRLFMNAKFLSLFFNQIGTLRLDSNEISFINRITYDYWSLKDKDNNICNLLLQISAYINNTLIIKLGSKLANREAQTLAMIANSTPMQDVRIHRINRFLVNCEDPVLETQEIIDIMFFLYDNFLYPIIYTLLEDESCCRTIDNIPQYHKLMNAIVTIMLSTTSEKMKKIVTEYGYIINSGKMVPSIRLKDIQDARLQEVIRQVEEDPLIKQII